MAGSLRLQAMGPAKGLDDLAGFPGAALLTWSRHVTRRHRRAGRPCWRSDAPADTTGQDGDMHPARDAERSPASVDQASFPVPEWDRYRPVRFLGQGGMGR